jgi:hypothetical protein
MTTTTRNSPNVFFPPGGCLGAEARVYGMCCSDALCCKLDPGVNPIYAERSPRYGGDLSTEASNTKY